MRVKACRCWGGCTVVGHSATQTWHCIWMGRGQPLLALAEAADWERSGSLAGVPGLPQSASWPTSSTCSSPSCSSAASIWGWRCRFLDGGECILKGNRNKWDPTLRASAPEPCNTTPPPSKAMLATEHKRSPSWHLGHDLAPPLPASPLTKVTAASTPWGKIWPMFTSDPTLPPKPLGTHRLYMDAPIQGYPFKNGIGNCFTEFHRNRERKAN